MMPAHSGVSRGIMKTNDRADIIDLVTHLGTTHGVGTVVADGRPYDGVSYFLEISLLGNGIKRINGMIDAKPAVLERITGAGQSLLTLETGQQVPIIVAQAVAGHAEIRILGSLPGTVMLDAGE